MLHDKYEAVIGLEVHAQLQTRSKLFCGDSTAFGAAPNTHVSAISLAHPGTLPRTNKKAVEYAVKMGLACNCSITQQNYFARKNYFYPDLPKGYQVSQHTTPICVGGIVPITVNGKQINVQLNRIHLEEDAGKSIHDLSDEFTCIDLNRAGTPLIEIVTEPCMHSADEAFAYVTAIRKLVRWLNICDGNMEEGSLRCDANVSIRLKGETKLGTKVEIKNLNSIRNVKRAIDIEIERMIGLAEKGERIIQQTRSYDADRNTTFSMRDKEEANDYRYFADPDIAPFYLKDDYISDIKALLPLLSAQLEEKFKADYKLNDYDAAWLCEDKEIADLFEATAKYTANYKGIANIFTGPLKQFINDNDISYESLHNKANHIAALINIIDEGKVNFSVASSKILPAIIKEDKTPLQIAEELNLLQTNNTDELNTWIDAAIAAMPDKVKEYQKGKKGLIGLFVGEVKKLSKGKADPKIVTTLLEEKLK